MRALTRSTVVLAATLGVQASAEATPAAPSGVLLRFEYGIDRLDLRVAPDDFRPDDRDTPTASLAGGGEVSSLGATMRALAGVERWLYGGFEFGFGSVRRSPKFASESAYRSDEQRDATGRTATVSLVVGVQATNGPLFLGFEAAGGLRGISLRPEGDDASSTLMRPQIDLRTRFGAWISPGVSVSAVFGTSLLRVDDRSASVVLGFSAFPWDGSR